MTQIALFPIPNSVIFPGNRFPLHVFEPRYRAMIHHCVDNDLLLGVCHTQKILREVSAPQDRKAKLSSNQNTYKPCSIFSAGECEIVEVFEDGRLHVIVDAVARYKHVRDTQNLPFIVCEAEKYEDLPLGSQQLQLSSDENESLKEKVYMRLCALAARMPDVYQALQKETWMEKSPERFSFDIFNLVQLEANMQQRVLESRSSSERLHLLLYQLNQSSTHA